MPAMLNRRECLQSMLAAGALSPGLLTLAGCGLEPTCPEDPAESAGVNWTPDILHPMFGGFQELDQTSGAPGPLRIFFPTYDGSPQNARILKLCLVRYPVVMFLHGQPPCTDASYFRRWLRLPMMLARSGYVVVVPKHDAALPADAESPTIPFALRVLDWVRSGWEHSRWVDKDLTATAIVGHSFGGLLAARVRNARPTIGTFASLSTGWAELPDPTSLLQTLTMPSFFMWGSQADGSENMDAGGVWQKVASGTKTKAVFVGKHFDYLTPSTDCAFDHGGCALIEPVAAELVALFISRHMPVKLSHAPIPPSLVPPTVMLTFEQRFFAGSHLNGIQAIRTRAGCGIDLTWEDPLDSGTRHLGP